MHTHQRSIKNKMYRLVRHIRRAGLKRIGIPVMRYYWKTFKPVRLGARAILLRDKEILLVKNLGTAYWSLPGGGIKRGEDPYKGLLRELREELGYIDSQVELDYELGIYGSEREGKDDTIYIYVIQTLDTFSKICHELETAQWFDIEQLPFDTSPATMRRVREFRSGAREVRTNW